MRTILIVGNEGEEVSSVVSELLRNQDVEIRLFSQIAPIPRNARVTWISGDPFSLEDLLGAMENVQKVYYFERLAACPLRLVQGSPGLIELLIATNIILATKISGPTNLELKRAKLDPSLEIETLFKDQKITSQNSNHLVCSMIDQNTVRSIQHFVLPQGRDARWVGEEYFRWLPKFSSNLVKVKYDGDECVFSLFNEGLVILKLRRSPSVCESKISFDVIGGLLNSKISKGKLEFTESIDKRSIFGALHNFVPALPWLFYRFGQAIVHVLVMGAFKEHLNWCYITEDHK